MSENENEKKEKNIVLKMILRKIKAFIIKWILIMSIVLIFAGAVYAIVAGILRAITSVIDNITSTIQQELSSEEEGETNYSDFSNGITITDEDIQKIVDVIEENGSTLRNLYLEADGEDTNKYLKQFLHAQLCTQFPDFGIVEDSTHFNGIIQIKRAFSNLDVENAVDMKYVPIQIFDNIIAAINLNSKDGLQLGGYQNYTIGQLQTEIQKLYSINGSGTLYFSSWKSETVDEETTFVVEKKSISYKSTVEKYGMPMIVLLALCEVSRNPEYVYNFIEEHVLTGEIVITILDEESVDTKETWYNWTEKIETTIERENVSSAVNQTDEERVQTTHLDPIYIERNNQYYSKTVIKTVTSSAQITSVDTWMAKQNVKYTNIQGQIKYPLGQETVKTPAECPSNVEGTTVSKRSESPYEITTTTTTTVEDCNKETKEVVVYNEMQRGIVTVDTAAMEEKARKIIRQWDKKYQVSYEQKKLAAGRNIVIGAEVLMELLTIDESTQLHKDIYKYLLYLYTGDDYGIKSLDTSIYNDIELIDTRPSHERPSGEGGTTGTVDLDGNYNVNGVILSNPITAPIAFVGSYSEHGAVDINPVQNGGTPVYAAAPGTVTTAKTHNSYGNYVIIDHGSGVSTLYAHAESLVVAAGQTVERGQLIMYEGSTGNSSGPHVHFEIRINGVRNQSLAEDMFRGLGYTIRY